MVPGHVRDDVAALVRAVQERPREHPIAELTRVHGHGLDVTVEWHEGTAVATITSRADPAFERLTRREHEVATLVAAGLSNAQIAGALFISVATVKDHVHSILTTTGFESRSQMIAAWYGGRLDAG